MKKTTISLLLAGLTIAGGLGGCTKLTRGFDENPNTASDAPSTLQLTGAQLAEGLFMSGESARTANIWAGVFRGADRQYQALQNYITTTQDYSTPWTIAYQSCMTQLRIVESKATSVGNKQLTGIAQASEGLMIGTVAALWGDVPYSQAFVENTPPTFDAQATVYAATQTLLTTAIGNLTANAGAGASVSADIFYGGNQFKWVAAAHSLKARYYLHVKNYASALTEAQQGITSSANDLLMPYAGAVGISANPYWDFLNNRTAYLDGVGSYAPTLLLARTNSKTNETARYKYFYNDSDPSIYSDRDPNWIDGAFQATSSFPLITYVETQAIIAECQARAGNTAAAITALNNLRAYDASTYTGSGALYTAYVASDFTPGGVANPTSSGQTAAAALLKEVLLEKYFSLIGQIEEFNDVRRTNNLIGVPINTSTASALPQRFLYPLVELNTNPNTPNPVPSLFTKTPVNQ
ncbi:SusD/RagB family nutrient-binding outer membrane lipoprotein [Hymenobacter cheonanensis]|uniref:SusD/RagB family nutrient-binding outer membrane lipoprotein n=1 Tax=Hymenobacter sp. CA2-7 TaxID=3063993 RepID=UPI0027144972|nr:SusD/RagB family nutrient-binding outer membrane lipoprotein [Hymenobacter sp. CA2-7]MDO7885250.1 SusD/RagB family nutrient-binding outer membrane lipoprotein [Hymenobacter sp. CA2-7]